MMLKAVWACALGVPFAAMPALAQTIPEPQTAEADATLIGLPIFSIDGKELGRMTEFVVDDGEIILIAEIERPLGFGPTIVVIPAGMVERTADRIKLKITAGQVWGRLVGHRH